MSDNPHISLEQWRSFIAVVDHDGYAKAALALHKSQSAVTYNVQKLESQLNITAFEIVGRKAVLTPTGHLLYHRATNLLAEAARIERAAKKLSAGWEAEIRLAVELIFPTWLLLDCLHQFGLESPHTRIELIESVLGGTTEALLTGAADLVIAHTVPPGFLGSPLIQLCFIAVAHPEHALHKLNRPLTMLDLQAERHLVIRESGSKRNSNAIALQAPQRWTVGHIATSIEAVSRGYGFAWFPEENIRAQLETGTLKQLSFIDGGERYATLYLILADADGAGPGTTRLAQLIRAAVTRNCPNSEKHSGHNCQDQA